jgi:hypothetical protein
MLDRRMKEEETWGQEQPVHIGVKPRVAAGGIPQPSIAGHERSKAPALDWTCACSAFTGALRDLFYDVALARSDRLEGNLKVHFDVAVDRPWKSIREFSHPVSAVASIL